MQTTLSKPRPADFYADAKRLAQPTNTLDAFLAKYKIEYEILAFEKRQDFPLMVGDHYVVHLQSVHGATGCWATVTKGVEMTIEKFMAGLQRECRFVAASETVLAASMMELGLVGSRQEALLISRAIKDNVDGFRFAFGISAVDELATEVIL